MNYSHQSFYDVIKDDLKNHPGFEFNYSEFEKNLLEIVISFNEDTIHFRELPLGRNSNMYMPETPFGEFVDGISFLLTDFTPKRDIPLLQLAMFVSIELLKEKLETML